MSRDMLIDLGGRRAVRLLPNAVQTVELKCHVDEPVRQKIMDLSCSTKTPVLIVHNDIV